MSASNTTNHQQAAPALRVFAPAKINWVLTIERKREDGFHDLATIFQTLAWGDELHCRPLAEPVCQIACDWPQVPTGPTNLVARAWRLLAEEYPGRVGGLAVRLDKRVPAGAGLGGGSADAAAALLAVNRLYRLGLRRERLEDLAGHLGSDCAFFVRGGSALGLGRGERLEPIVSRLPDVWLVVVFPGFPSPTAEAYGRVRPQHWEDGAAATAARRAIEAGDLMTLESLSKNTFYPIALATDMRYKELEVSLTNEGLRRPMLSGSGSAMFALATGAAHARAASRRLAQQYPLAVATRLARSGVRVLPSQS